MTSQMYGQMYGSAHDLLEDLAADAAPDHAVALRPAAGAPHRRAAVVTPGMIGRLILTLIAFAAASILAASLLAFPSLARAEGLAASTVAPSAAALRLRGDVVARSDVLSLADLVENAPAALADRPLFRAPALGAAGTIQVRRILEALDRLDLGGLDSGGRVQIQVQRAARRVGPPEIEAALKLALAGQGLAGQGLVGQGPAGQGLDPANLTVRVDGEASLLAPLDLDGPVRALDLTYDPRSRRLAALVVLGERQASLRVTAQVAETREVAVLARPLGRGEALSASDFTIERRARETAPQDAIGAATGAVGQVAQRPLSAGAVLRAGDLAPPDLVERGQAVAIVFETPGVSLSLTGLANESGRLGATVSVLNPASKKTLQAVVVGPGRVSVGPARAPQMPMQMQASADLRPAY